MRIGGRIVLSVSALLVVATGCSSDKADFNSIVARPAPEMASTTDRWVDADRDYAYMRNTNQRGFLDDLSRSLYLDNPSRLSPYPIVDTSGNPR